MKSRVVNIESAPPRSQHRCEPEARQRQRRGFGYGRRLLQAVRAGSDDIDAEFPGDQA
jgi:hypothetical protein